MNEPMIVLNELNKSFGEIQAVRNLSLSIEAGTIFGFLGANGAGKTTTIRMLCGLTHPSAEPPELPDTTSGRNDVAVRSKFGYVAQRFSLYPDLTVEENLRFFAGACRVPPSEIENQVRRLFKLTDLEEKRGELAGSLSGGMKQLLSLACALVHDPPLLFLDEPTSGLDPVHRHLIWNLLYDLGDAGKTIFVTTHYMDEAERCTEVGFLHDGRLLAKASPRALKSSFRSKLLEIDVDPVMPALVRLRSVPEILGVSLRSGSARIYTAEPEKLIERWKTNWPFPDLRLLDERWVEPDMEDVFTAYSQGYDEVLTASTP